MEIEIPVLDHGYVRYIDHLGSDLRIVEAARVSYRSPSKGDEQDKKLLFYLWKNKHTSPFEQASITFNIKLPLFVQAQIVRHRTQKLNQVSARYTEMKDEFYIPMVWRKQDTVNKQGSVLEEVDDDFHSANHCLTTDVCERCYAAYQDLLRVGVAKEMARMVLPQNLYTEIYTNFDLHNLMHFLGLRMDTHAQFEVRQYANAMYKIFETLFPWSAEAFSKYKFKVICEG